MKKRLYAMAFFASLGAGLLADEGQTAKSSKAVHFALNEEGLQLKSFENHRFQWGGEGKEAGPVYLSFETRIEGKGFRSGGAQALRVSVNRIPVTMDRMVNKQPHWIHGRRSVGTWGGAHETLGALYHAWDDETPSMGRLHRYVFDITTLLDEKGQVEVDFASVYAAIEGAHVEVRNIEIILGGVVERHPFPAIEQPLYLSEPLHEFRQKALAFHQSVKVPLDVSADFDATHSIALNTKVPLSPTPAPITQGDRLAIAGPSLPVEIGLRVGHKGAGGWKEVKGGAQEGDAWVWSDGTIRLERRLKVTPHGTDILDKVTNLTEADVATGFLYEVELSEGVETLREFRLFGRKRDVFFTNSSPSRESANVPTVYLKNRAGAGLGIVAEDDVLRNQASYLAWDNTLAFGTDLFYLPAKGEYEFHFSVSSAGDYYLFLNHIRQKWEMFETIPGLFGFVYPFKQDKKIRKPETLASFLEETGIAIPCVVPSLDYDSGDPKMLYGQERPESIRQAAEGVADFAKTLREAKPEAPLLFYTDVHLMRTDGDETMLKEMEEALIVDARGQLVEYREGWLYNLLPVEGNSAGKRFRENLETLMNVPGVKGVFLDEWDHSKASWSFTHPDGHSAQVGPGFEIQRKIGKVPLLTKNYQKQLVDYLVGQGAIIFANQFDATRQAINLPIIHFAEPTQADSYLLHSAQMGRTPLSLTVKRSTRPWSDVQEFLQRGVLTCFYARRLTGDHLLRHLYPFTAERIGPGYVIGRERLVTLVNGTYTFGTPQAIKAKIFGGEGGRFLRHVEVPASEDGSPTTLSLTLDRAMEEVAIIEAL